MTLTNRLDLGKSTKISKHIYDEECVVMLLGLLWTQMGMVVMTFKVRKYILIISLTEDSLGKLS